MERQRWLLSPSHLVVIHAGGIGLEHGPREAGRGDAAKLAPVGRGRQIVDVGVDPTLMLVANSMFKGCSSLDFSGLTRMEPFGLRLVLLSQAIADKAVNSPPASTLVSPATTWSRKPRLAKDSTANLHSFAVVGQYATVQFYAGGLPPPLNLHKFLYLQVYLCYVDRAPTRRS